MTPTTEQAIAAHVSEAVAADLAGHLITRAGSLRIVLLYTEDAEDAGHALHGVFVGLAGDDPEPIVSAAFPADGPAEQKSAAFSAVMAEARKREAGEHEHRPVVADNVTAGERNHRDGYVYCAQCLQPLDGPPS